MHTSTAPPRVHDFIQVIRSRSDVRAPLTSVLRAARFDDRPPDGSGNGDGAGNGDGGGAGGAGGGNGVGEGVGGSFP